MIYLNDLKMDKEDVYELLLDLVNNQMSKRVGITEINRQDAEEIVYYFIENKINNPNKTQSK